MISFIPCNQVNLARRNEVYTFGLDWVIHKIDFMFSGAVDKKTDFIVIVPMWPIGFVGIGGIADILALHLINLKSLVLDCFR